MKLPHAWGNRPFLARYFRVPSGCQGFGRPWKLPCRRMFAIFATARGRVRMFVLVRFIACYIATPIATPRKIEKWNLADMYSLSICFGKIAGNWIVFWKRGKIWPWFGLINFPPIIVCDCKLNTFQALILGDTCRKPWSSTGSWSMAVRHPLSTQWNINIDIGRTVGLYQRCKGDISLECDQYDQTQIAGQSSMMELA